MTRIRPGHRQRCYPHSASHWWRPGHVTTVLAAHWTRVVSLLTPATQTIIHFNLLDTCAAQGHAANTGGGYRNSLSVYLFVPSSTHNTWQFPKSGARWTDKYHTLLPHCRLVTSGPAVLWHSVTRDGDLNGADTATAHNIDAHFWFWCHANATRDGLNLKNRIWTNKYFTRFSFIVTKTEFVSKKCVYILIQRMLSHTIVTPCSLSVAAQLEWFIKSFIVKLEEVF